MRNIKLLDICLNLIIFIIIIITLYPFINVLSISLSDSISVLQHKVVLFPKNITLTAYINVFSNPFMLSSLVNSLIYTSIGTVLSVIFTLLTAYPLSKDNFYGKKLFMVMIIITLLFSVGIIPFYLVVRELGLLNKMWSVILPFLISPWNLILTRIFIENLPREIEQAAKIDGCGDLKYLYSIVIPLCTPIIATIAIYYAVGYWNMYFWPMMFLNKKETYPIQVLLRQIVIAGSMASETGRANAKEIGSSESIKAATIMVSTAPIIIVYPFLQKYFAKGIMIGAVKG